MTTATTIASSFFLAAGIYSMIFCVAAAMGRCDAYLGSDRLTLRQPTMFRQWKLPVQQGANVIIHGRKVDSVA